jgi:alpha-tubulin suppressor-like RCC1 family protein
VSVIRASQLLAATLAFAACSELTSAAGPVESVSASPGSLALSLGDTATLTAAALNADGRRLPDQTVHWASNDPRVATVTTDGLVRAVGTGTTTITAESGGRSTAVEVEVDVTFTAAGLGLLHSCAVTPGGRAACWGSNAWGKLGNGTIFANATPQLVVSDAPLAAVTGGSDHTCGLTQDGAAWCWGANWSAQLGTGSQDLERHPTATPVSGGLRFTLLTIGDRHTCGLTADGALYCWGANLWGQLGTTAPQDFCPVASELCGTEPLPVASSATFTAASAGREHTCAVTDAGDAYCWGRNHVGQLGDGTTLDRATPVLVAGGLTFAAVAAGEQHTCGITSDGSAYCWGLGSRGRLGNDSVASSTVPVAVSGGIRFASITAGDEHACGIDPDGTAYCWGSNSNGQLGDGTGDSRSVPVAVAGGLSFASLSGGLAHTCGFATGGLLYCWGGNASGQLGTGTGSAARTPTAVFGQK